MTGDVTLVSALERLTHAMEQIAACLEVQRNLPALADKSKTLTPLENQPVLPVVSKLATLETIRERLAKWLPDLEIMDGFDGFAVKPKRFLGETWSEVNEVVRAFGGKWQKGQTPRDGSWRIPK